LLETIRVNALPRPERGKNAARRLRAQGRVPAIVYGHKGEPAAVSLVTKEIVKILQSPHGHNQILDLSVEGGQTEPVMAVDWQLDPVRGFLLHVDLSRLDLTRKITVDVQVAVTGTPKGVKDEGGVMEAIAREVEVECLPRDVPESIEVDVSDLGIGDAIRVEDLPVSENFKILSEPDTLLVHVVPPRAEEEIAAEEEAAPEAAEEKPEEAEEAKGEEEQEES